MTTVTLRPLTARQRSVWWFIRDHYARTRHGVCIREICDRFAMKSPHGAAYTVNVLIRKGWVEWSRGRGEYRAAYGILPSRDSLEVPDGSTT